MTAKIRDTKINSHNKDSITTKGGDIVKKKFIVPTTFVVGLILISIFSVSTASARHSENYPIIIERLAERFNLDESEVESVFDEVRDEKRAEMYAEWEQDLSEAVEAGKLTESQKTSLLEMHNAIEDNITNIDGLSLEERNERMHKLHFELRAWANENNIDLSEIMPHRGRPRHMMGLH